MSSIWMRQTTWAVVAIAAFGVGFAAIRAVSATPRVPRAASNDVVSRASDSEVEVSPSLASSADGSLAVAWIADSGGRDGGGRYVGVRISEPNGGKLGPLLRVETRGANVSHDAIVALPGNDFLLVWQGNDSVYAARISRGGAAAPVTIAEHASEPRASTTPNGTVLVSFKYIEGNKPKFGLAISHDAATFPYRFVGDAAEGAIADVCGGDEYALVTDVDPARGVMVHRAEIAGQAPIDTSTVSTIGEHVARGAAPCFVTSEESFVVYGETEHPQDMLESRIAEALVFVRSRDGGRNFVTRAAHRTSSHVLWPTIIHREGSFTLLAVMGAGSGDAHASASVLVLGADGRSQNGLTRTVIAPMTMVPSPDAAGWIGDSLGLTVAGGVTWAAVPDNGGGEAHVTLSRVL